MSRRRKAPRSESRASRKYNAGKAVRYKHRIRGPQSPITTYSVNELPEDSSLRSPP